MDSDLDVVTIENETNLHENDETEASSKLSITKIKENVQSHKWSLETWSNATAEGFCILVNENSKKTNIRVCVHCYSFYNRTSRTSIKNHSKIHSQSDKSTNEELLIKCATKFVTQDGRSFRTIDTKAFQEYSRFVAKTAVQMHLDGKSFDTIKLPTSYDVAKELESSYQKAKTEFQIDRLPVAIKNGCSVTFDFSQAGPDYAVVTLHFIDNQW